MATLGRFMPSFRSEYCISTFNGKTSFSIIRQFRKPTKENAREPAKEFGQEAGEFRVLSIRPEEFDLNKPKRPPRVVPMPPPRTEKMKPDQDWTNVWPGPRTFHPASVPLPLAQGCMKKGRPPPGKIANTELMKIPNFLHLTEKAIRKHCEALKPFCTEFPEALKSEEVQEKFFPVNIIHSDYCHSVTTIRDPMSRIVSLKIKLKTLNLDKHARDKFLRLVGNRYDPKTDVLTITTDSCPMRAQNYDYAHYLLTALFYESCKTEDWEAARQDEDQENYIFSERQSIKNVKRVFDYNNREMPNTDEYAKAVQNWHDEGDNDKVIAEYKKACLKLLNLPTLD